MKCKINMYLSLRSTALKATLNIGDPLSKIENLASYGGSWDEWLRSYLTREGCLGLGFVL